jgi:hypothetical protein
MIVREFCVHFRLICLRMFVTSPKPRAVLTKDQVRYIFRLSLSRERPSASHVARLYRVSEKTVRDIWTARTWREETKILDAYRGPQEARKTGRPLGRKDSKPRRAKTKKSEAKVPTRYSKSSVVTSEDDSKQDHQTLDQAMAFHIAFNPRYDALGPNLQDIDSCNNPRDPRLEHINHPTAFYTSCEEKAMTSSSPRINANHLQSTFIPQAVQDLSPHNDQTRAPLLALNSILQSVPRPQLISLMTPPTPTMPPPLITTSPAFIAAQMSQPPPPISMAAAFLSLSSGNHLLGSTSLLAAAASIAAAAAAAAPRSPWDPSSQPAAPFPVALAGPPPPPLLHPQAFPRH